MTALAVLPLGCATDAARDDAPHLIWNVHEARFVTESELLADLHRARYRLLGEMHDNLQHHRIQAHLIEAIAAGGVRPAVVMEQIDFDLDQKAVALQRNVNSGEAFAQALPWNDAAWPLVHYRPLIEAIVSARLPIRAGNVARRELMRLVQSGDALTKAPWATRLDAAQWTAARESALRNEIVASHCGKLPESMVPALVLAQRVRDAAMAEALVRAATADGAILIAGNGHVRNDRGVPLYLHAPGLQHADATSISVGFLEVAAGDAAENVLATQGARFDYAWLTPPASRGDPCAGMAIPAPSAKRSHADQ